MTSRRLARIDALLLLMTLIWGTNYSIVKFAFQQIEPQAFNAVRMIIASLVFLGIIVVLRRGSLRGEGEQAGRGRIASIFHTPAPVTRREWLGFIGLGIVGHCLYQYCFIGGLARTSVANSSLMLAATPVVIALLSAVLGFERISRLHWLGALLSIGGIYIVIGQGAAVGGASLRGDLLMFAAVCCWAVYTLGARPLMAHHSPVGVTGISMAIGSLLYVPLMVPRLRAVAWAEVSLVTWVALVYSALFALCVAYTIWYMAVREIGSARTSMYSNIIPIVAMLTAVLFLGESLSAAKAAGAAAVLVGVALTRAGKTTIPITAE